jgi:hypothetical protein
LEFYHLYMENPINWRILAGLWFLAKLKFPSFRDPFFGLRHICSTARLSLVGALVLERSADIFEDLAILHKRRRSPGTTSFSLGMITNRDFFNRNYELAIRNSSNC